ncbi:MAG: hypothetical protein B6241_13475 [Spirochaetaceae bacterium 4572_59]|nr:MAG: hypothetical protein B6241_13475 [Spirochaetaceae bacterium 4572_59]
MLDQLTHLVLVYQRLGQHSDILQKEINLYIYRYPARGYELPEEEWVDFFLSIQQRVGSLVTGFEYRGFSFRTYLNRTLQWHLKTYRRGVKKKLYNDWVLERESVLAYPECCDCFSNEYELRDKILYVLKCCKLTAKRRTVLKTRLFFLLLKNILFIREPELLDCAEILAYPRMEAMKYRNQLLCLLQDRIFRRDLMIQRRNSCYHKETYCGKQMGEYTNTGQKKELQDVLTHYNGKKQKINDQIHCIHILPTNREISMVLNIPKGSVDSGLYYLKKNLKAMDSRLQLVRKSEMNYSAGYGNSIS